MTLKILSFNILHDQGDWPGRSKAIGAWIDRLQPDVVGLQEVLRGDSMDQTRSLLADRGFETAFAEASRFWVDRDLAFGNAIGSRWPIESTDVLTLSRARPGNGRSETRCALAARIDAPAGPLELACTHLHWRFDHGYVRERQVVEIAEWLGRRAPESGWPPVLVGDFNADPESAEMRYLAGLQSIDGRSCHFRDAWAVAGGDGRGHTWSRENPLTHPWLEPDRRIDYIWVGMPRRDGQGVVERCAVVGNEPVDGVWPSDHFAVYAELRGPQEAQAGAAGA
ncbi:MAG: endonuclease/exonuclease/phosphatase family protein [Myxococcota bacterium]